jgi:hypothetical protein
MQRLIIAVAAAVLLSGCGTPVAAQGVASSFEQLAVLVKPGDKVTASRPLLIPSCERYH